MLRKVTALVSAVLMTTALGAATTASAGLAPTSSPQRPASELLAKQGGAPANLHVTRKAVNARAAAVFGPSGELRGMALNDYSLNRSITTDIPDFPRMAAEGITSVTAYLYLYLSDPRGNVVTTGVQTPTTAELTLVSAAATLSGLQVIYEPVLIDTATNSWRGGYSPSDRGAFFASYTSMLASYADLAQANGVSMLYVGSENSLIESDTSRWKAVIVTTRKHFSGALTYMSVPGTFSRVKFWNQLDVAAISPYFSMGNDPLPTYNRMLSAWKTAIFPYVQKLLSAIKVPLVFGELGYDSQRGSFSSPELKASLIGTPAPAAQADAYAALLDSLAGFKGIYGVTWWRWSTTTVADMGWSPAGKPAECVLAGHWSESATVRSLAAQPVCDLHAVDQLGGVAGS